eukprot:31370-Pelagococcus_subviridis.AAC.3
MRPVTGAHKMPQQLCPHAMYAPSTPGTAPRIGSASGGHGRMHDCVFRGPPAPTLALRPAKDFAPAATRDGSGVTTSARSVKRSAGDVAGSDNAIG